MNFVYEFPLVFPFQDQKSDNITWEPEGAEIVWSGLKVPQDRTIVKKRLLKVNLWLYLSMVLVAVVGVIFAISMVYFNFRYGHRRIIQHCKGLILLYLDQFKL